MSKLMPVVVNKKNAAAAATEGGRKRGILAINDAGQTVVCCRRTAVSKGWQIQQVLFKRSTTPAEDFAPAAAKKTSKHVIVDIDDAPPPAAKKTSKRSVADMLD